MIMVLDFVYGPSGSMFILNNKGPRMEPWGTPRQGATGKDALPIATEKVLFDTYELNHLRTVSPASKAELKARRIKTK